MNVKTYLLTDTPVADTGNSMSEQVNGKNTDGVVVSPVIGVMGMPNLHAVGDLQLVPEEVQHPFPDVSSELVGLMQTDMEIS